MSVAASGRTWEDASSPAALRLTRRYEEAWRDAGRSGTRLDPGEFLSTQGESGELPGSWLAVLRSDLALRWGKGDRVTAGWYLDRFPNLAEDAQVALVYEEFCLREEDGEEIELASFFTRYEALAEPLRRVLDIHRLVGSAGGSTSTLFPQSSVSVCPATAGHGSRVPFPEAGETIGGFFLVEELGRGAFARVFLRASGSSRIGSWRSRSRARGRVSPRPSPASSTQISFPCTHTGSIRRPGCTCSACRISVESRWPLSWPMFG